jgi:hypothetical protein
MSRGLKKHVFRNSGTLHWAVVTVGIALLMSVGRAQAQLPDNVVAELRKLGQVVEPGCTAKLMRPMMPKNDYNTYWPVEADQPNTKVKLYPGVTLARDVSYGPEGKDLIDIFMGDKGGAGRTVLIYVPGGAGNKLEQQSVEANAFYDNIGRWAAENGMVGVTMQRGGSPGNQGQNVALMIDWLKTNIAKYKGNPDRMFIWAHSAGNGPLGQYIGRPDLYGVGVRGAIFMSGNPVNFGGGRGAAVPPAGGPPAAAGRGAAGAGGPAGGQGGGGRGAGGGAPGQIGTSTCTNAAGAGSQAGVIRGPSSQLADQGKNAAARRSELAGSSPWRWTGTEWVNTGAVSAPSAAAEGGARGGGGPGGAAAAAGGQGAGGRGGGGRGAGGGAGAGAPAGGRGPADGAGNAANQPNPQILGFQTTRVAILLARAELDPGVNGGMQASDIAIHDELCKLEGPKAKDGVGHCPTMLYLKGQSHMSEVFSIGSADKSVSGPILEWIKRIQ